MAAKSSKLVVIPDLKEKMYNAKHSVTKCNLTQIFCINHVPGVTGFLLELLDP
jgi:hypothetical protein